MTTDETNNSHASENYLAALDIGSNSIHFVLARYVNDQIQILHAEKYRARLADGLSKNNVLSDEAINRGVNILANIASATEQLTPDNFRAVGTYTLRQAKNFKTFLNKAAKVFPFDIEIISGHEEARLIYSAVNQLTHSKHTQLVIDIGGGSTECIIGTGNKIATLASLSMGCISYTQKFFATGVITSSAFDAAINSAKREIDSIVKRFNKHDVKEVLGTSGTLKALYKIVNHDKELNQPVNLKDLILLKKTLIKQENINNIDIKGLKDNRAPAICAGLAITIALMQSLKINQFNHCPYALREGVLFEQLDDHANTDNNTRARTINSFKERFSVDETYANTVKNHAFALISKVTTAWGLNKNIYKELLGATAQLHEIGLDINASGYHKHGAYIINNADLPGFNQEQQQALAWLVNNQRKKIDDVNALTWYLLNPQKIEKLCIIVRLSILLTQQRYINDMFTLDVSADENSLTLVLDKKWLAEHPIVESELYFETEIIKTLNINLIIES